MYDITNTNFYHLALVFKAIAYPFLLFWFVNENHQKKWVQNLGFFVTILAIIAILCDIF